MKSFNKIMLAAIIVVLLSTFNSFGQKGHGHHGGGHHGPGPHKVANAIRRSAWRPAKLAVYHPYWGPKRQIYRRWVFFPKYNLYWDNWRNHYVWYNNNVWVSQPTAPPVIVNVNLDNEKHYELKENDDDDDDVYKSNDNHKTEYKGD